jgi:hypothetical protein
VKTFGKSISGHVHDEELKHKQRESEREVWVMSYLYFPFYEVVVFCRDTVLFFTYPQIQCQPQREGMGLLEYILGHASLRDIAHDGLLCTFTLHITAAGKYISSQLDNSCQGNRYCTEKAGSSTRPSHTKSHLRVTLLQPARRAAVLGRPLAFGLIEKPQQPPPLLPPPPQFQRPSADE